MTLCKYRPVRTYDAQYLFEQNDVNGLLKMLGEAARAMGEAGLASTPYYVGALLAFEVMFGGAERNGDVDTWQEFMRSFEAALEEMEGGMG